MKGRIAEVFESVQGEGIYLGEKQIFVRFFGCNLSCKYCDTKLNRFTDYEPEELFEEIKIYEDDYHSISFTGGEPLLQSDFLKEVLKLTHQAGYKNYLETNGTLSGELKGVIDYVDIIAMDLKLPSSTQMGNMWGFHSRFLKVASQKDVFLKAIICDSTTEADFKEALKFMKESNGGMVLVLQPDSFTSSTGLKEKLENFRALCLLENVTSCVIPQMHRMVGIQ
jgi:organic radical activating enzyme